MFTIFTFSHQVDFARKNPQMTYVNALMKSLAQSPKVFPEAIDQVDIVSSNFNHPETMDGHDCS